MTDRDRGAKFRLGVFVLGTLILLALLIILFENVPRLLSRQLAYHVVFAEAPGLSQGMSVRKSGVKIGEVDGYDLDPDTGEVTVHIIVERKHQLRVGDDAVLSRSLILGEAAINFISIKDGDKTLAEDGHSFVGKSPADLSGVLGKASDLAGLSAETLRETQVAMSRLAAVSETLDLTIRGNQERVNQTLENLSEASRRASRLLNEDNEKEVAALLRNLRSSSDDLAKLIKRTDAAVADASKQADGLMTDLRKSSKQIADRADSVGAKAEMLVTDASKSLDQFNKQLATTGKNLDDLLIDGRKQVNDTGKNVEMFLTEGQKQLQQANKNVEQFLADTQKQLQTANKNLELFLAEGQKQMQVATKSFDDLSKEGQRQLQAAGKNVDDLSKEGQQAVRRANWTMVKAEEAMGEIQKVVKSFGERAPVILKNFEETSTRIGTAAEQVGVFTRALSEGNGTVRKLVSDPALYNNLNETATALSKSMSRVEKLIRDVEVFADKIARHPEILGVGGAVSPSSGIKR
jgi:phospholipid/cholesterol/gamma-HCH transport system substrate-binding protein